ncbi:peptidoglycan endopeptidase [Desulfobacula sp.]|uniref:peptidoglycan endopeptidase n=1 Tax=Desulfobacula sp. TaxID=2593537 RepID=UPI0025C06A53|nr:peptidoglycan endopeptidase [Desulfobacula sp.]MBC2705486.1 C40 family peptidase [Desulfobacula sp.]
MKKNLIIVILILFSTVSVWGLNDKSIEHGNADLEEQKRSFRKNIPPIAVRFIGIPYKLGGNPQQSGTTDNSHLFFSIYSLAAQKAGLSYKEYLPIKYLLRDIREVNKDDLKNGDLIVLNDNHTAMVYQVENTGKLHLIYSSGKRQQVLSFTSDHIVFHAYWLKNLKGFYRLSDTMLAPAD